MIYEITTYRKYPIRYDEDTNKFIVELMEIVEIDEDNDTTYASLSDAKTSIDEFLKFNTNFVPFKALKKLYFGYNDVHEIQVVGVRSDGILVYKIDSDDINFLQVHQQHLLYNYDVNFLTDIQNLRNEYDVSQTKYYANINTLIDSLVQIDFSNLPK